MLHRLHIIRPTLHYCHIPTLLHYCSLLVGLPKVRLSHLQSVLNAAARLIARLPGMVLYCIVFIHFYSASHSLSLSEALPTTAIDTVS